MTVNTLSGDHLTVINHEVSKRRRWHAVTGLAGIAGLRMGQGFAERDRGCRIMTSHATGGDTGMIHRYRAGTDKGRRWLAMTGIAHIRTRRMGGALG